MTPTGLKLKIRSEFDTDADVLQVIGTILRISKRDDWHFERKLFKKCPHVLRRIAELMQEEVDLDGLSSEELLVPVRVGIVVERTGVLIALADDVPENQYSEMMVA